MQNNNKITKLEDLHLFPSKKILLRNSMDRYGFSFVVAERLKFKYTRRSFCNWVHGWVWWEDVMEARDIIGPFSNPTDVPVVVGTEAQYKTVMSEYPNLKAVIGGVPYIYCPNFIVEKQKHVLLAFLAHSAEGEKHDVVDAQYLDYLSSIKDSWEKIFVSVYYLDVTPVLVNEIERRGLKVLVGANPADQFSMYRTKLMFSLADSVHSNVMGSHIAYALAENCKVSLFDDLYTYDPLTRLKTEPNFNIRDANKDNYVHSKEYLVKIFPQLFCDPTQAIRNQSMGRKFLGEQNILNNSELIDAIGWNARDQLEGYFKGIKNRVHKIIAPQKNDAPQSGFTNWKGAFSERDVKNLHTVIQKDLTILVGSQLTTPQINSIERLEFENIDYVFSNSKLSLAEGSREKKLQVLDSNLNLVFDFLIQHPDCIKINILCFQEDMPKEVPQNRKIKFFNLNSVTRGLAPLANSNKILTYIDTITHLRKAQLIESEYPFKKFIFVTSSTDIFLQLNKDIDIYYFSKIQLLLCIFFKKMPIFDSILVSRVDDLYFKLIYRFNSFCKLLTFDEGLFTIHHGSVYNSPSALSRRNSLFHKIFNLKDTSFFYSITNHHFTWFQKNRFEGLAIPFERLIKLENHVKQNSVNKIFIGQPWQFMFPNKFFMESLSQFINKNNIDIYLTHPREDIDIISEQLGPDVSLVTCHSSGEDFINKLLVEKDVEIFSIASTLVTGVSDKASIFIVESPYTDREVIRSQENLKETLKSQEYNFKVISIDETASI